MTFAVFVLGQHHGTGRQRSRFAIACGDPHPSIKENYELSPRGIVRSRHLVHGLHGKELHTININARRNPKFSHASFGRVHHTVERDVFEVTLTVLIGPNPQVIHAVRLPQMAEWRIPRRPQRAYPA
jgi:hypothetical protein